MDGWPFWKRLYQKQINRDLDIWVTKGWVTQQNAEAIRRSLENEDGGSRLPLVLSLLGAALLGLAALSFVAANWAEMPKLLRLLILFASLGAAYGAAIWLYLKKHTGFAEAALLLATLLFGANIMLIAQMYHLASDYTGGLFAWSLGALALAWAAKSRAVLAGSFVLLFIWTGTASLDAGISPHWTYIPAWAAATLLGFRLQWTPSYHLSLLTFFGWLLMGLEGFDNYHWDSGNLLFFALAIALTVWLKGRLGGELGLRMGRVAEAYGAIVTGILLFALQFDELDFTGEMSWRLTLLAFGAFNVALLFFCVMRRAFTMTGLAGFGALLALTVLPAIITSGETNYLDMTTGMGGILYFAFAIWLIFLGTQSASRFLVNLGFTAFAAEAFYIYAETLGTLLDTALFFALGGILLIAGSWALNRWRKKMLAETGKGEAQ